MKNWLLFLSFIAISHYLTAQQVILRESDSDGQFSFVKVNKHTDSKGDGEILSFDINVKSKQMVLKSFPKRDFSWFGYYDGFLYFSHRQTLFKTMDGIKKESVFVEENKMVNILSAEVLPN